MAALGGDPLNRAPGRNGHCRPTTLCRSSGLHTVGKEQVKARSFCGRGLRCLTSSLRGVRTRVWLPAVKASGVDFDVRVHDLRHAHASWLLSGGSDITSVMDRMGHAQITTTQKYLHPMPDADTKNTKNLTALNRIRGTGTGSAIGPD
jgi:integrase